MAKREPGRRLEPPPTRAAAAAARRARIVAAALAEFSDKGFEAARVEDIAARAEVAKGTIYLHFADKRALFEGIVDLVIGPALAALEGHVPDPGETVGDHLRRVLVPLAVGLAASPGRDVIHLLIAEGARFPEIAATYHRRVVSRGLAMVASLARLAQERGEAVDEALTRLPQLLFAPIVVGIVWRALFERHQPLDVEALIRAQIDLLFPSSAPRRVRPA